MSDISNLGQDQWKWLNKYKSISLEKWRLIPTGNPPLGVWMYIGDWTPYDSNGQKIAGRYIERDTLLKNNRYYFWPK